MLDTLPGLNSRVCALHPAWSGQQLLAKWQLTSHDALSSYSHRGSSCWHRVSFINSGLPSTTGAAWSGQQLLAKWQLTPHDALSFCSHRGSSCWHRVSVIVACLAPRGAACSIETVLGGQGIAQVFLAAATTAWGWAGLRVEEV